MDIITDIGIDIKIKFKHETANSKANKNWDEFTIANKPISSVNLMEHAATLCFNQIEKIIQLKKNQLNSANAEPSFFVFCGTGNNGGDGFSFEWGDVVTGFADNTIEGNIILPNLKDDSYLFQLKNR